MTMNWTIKALHTIFAVVRDNFGPFFTTSLVLSAPSLIVDLIDGGIVASLVVGLIANVLVTLSLTSGTLHAMAGARPDFASLIRQINRPGSGKLILLVIVQSLVIGLGLTLVVPGLYVLCLWMVALPAMIVERTTIGGALNRSANLTRERRWHVFGVVVAGVLIAGIPLGIIEYILDEFLNVVPGSTGDSILSWLVDAAMMTVLASLPAVLYVLLRGEKEGTTLPQIVTNLD
jgi:hypothetical protein